MWCVHHFNLCSFIPPYSIFTLLVPTKPSTWIPPFPQAQPTPVGDPCTADNHIPGHPINQNLPPPSQEDTDSFIKFTVSESNSLFTFSQENMLKTFLLHLAWSTNLQQVLHHMLREVASLNTSWLSVGSLCWQKQAEERGLREQG